MASIRGLPFGSLLTKPTNNLKNAIGIGMGLQGIMKLKINNKKI